MNILSKSKGWLQSQVERLSQRSMRVIGWVFIFLLLIFSILLVWIWQSESLNESERVAVKFYTELWHKRNLDAAMKMVSSDAQERGKGAAEAEIYLAKTGDWTRSKHLQLASHPLGKSIENEQSYVLLGQDRIYEVTVRKKNDAWKVTGFKSFSSADEKYSMIQQMMKQDDWKEVQIP